MTAPLYMMLRGFLLAEGISKTFCKATKRKHFRLKKRKKSYFPSFVRYYYSASLLDGTPNWPSFGSVFLYSTRRIFCPSPDKIVSRLMFCFTLKATLTFSASPYRDKNNIMKHIRHYPSKALNLVECQLNLRKYKTCKETNINHYKSFADDN